MVPSKWPKWNVHRFAIPLQGVEPFQYTSSSSAGYVTLGDREMRRTLELRRLSDPPCEFEKRDLTLHSGAALRGLNTAAFEKANGLDPDGAGRARDVAGIADMRSPTCPTLTR